MMGSRLPLQDTFRRTSLYAEGDNRAQRAGRSGRSIDPFQMPQHFSLTDTQQKPNVIALLRQRTAIIRVLSWCDCRERRDTLLLYHTCQGEQADRLPDCPCCLVHRTPALPRFARQHTAAAVATTQTLEEEGGLSVMYFSLLPIPRCRWEGVSC